MADHAREKDVPLSARPAISAPAEPWEAVKRLIEVTSRGGSAPPILGVYDVASMQPSDLARERAKHNREFVYAKDYDEAMDAADRARQLAALHHHEAIDSLKAKQQDTARFAEKIMGERDDAESAYRRVLEVAPRPDGEFEHLLICSGPRTLPPGEPGCVCPVGRPRKQLRALTADLAAVRRERDALERANAGLHDLVSSFDAVTNPEDHPDLHARAFALLHGDRDSCGNAICAEVTALLAERDALHAALTRLEFDACDDQKDFYCMACHQTRQQGHATGCFFLAALSRQNPPNH